MKAGLYIRVTAAALTLATLPSVTGSEAVWTVRTERPAASLWKRSQCGGPTGPADIPSKWADDVAADKTPLPAYPRPQLVRTSPAGSRYLGDYKALRDSGDAAHWINLNGLWEWEPATSAQPSFGKSLSGSILVPFPVESCLSGLGINRTADVPQHMWYRLKFDMANVGQDERIILHFGAVDWQTTVYMNKELLGLHTGGYDGFSFEITAGLKQSNELLVHVYDPSETGAQPNGKQRAAAIDRPGGDTYTSSSGIWQTVWLERVPASYVSSLHINQASLTEVSVTVETSGGNGEVTFEVKDENVVVSSASGNAGEAVRIQVPSPKLWSPSSPHLYDLIIKSGDDTVVSYFGLRTFELGGGNMTRPLLNQEFTFLAGFLDQSFWPDGLYTAPTDEALEYDLLATKMFGLNMIRLHQKVNPERWYYHADRHGLVLFQDMPQKYGYASDATIAFYFSDLRAMIAGRRNHPCIVQWTAFNEEDCYKVFENITGGIPAVVDLVRQLDPTRLVDTDSGGGANNLHVGDINDIHDYPYPKKVLPSRTQYAMVGEFGGMGIFQEGKEWVPKKCYGYLKQPNASSGAQTYVGMAATLNSQRLSNGLAASVYTQTTDVELECDGFLNYDRSNKFTMDETLAIFAANSKLHESGADRQPEPDAIYT
eukprot:TRINITY_DN100959_c0_g1_i1.p1 TRINITY_DN100959_c0_g1~~TRINITY_DN100959_c0_g1_i1.p1  ORF type:complete len:677 (-),score=99.43 TRINITY_DN100959_c0_g1_i1:260-2224(-)